MNNAVQEWYVAQPSGPHEGPLTLAMLRERAQAGALAPTSLIWKSGLPQWVMAHSVDELFSPTSSGRVPAASVMSSAAAESFAKRFGTPKFLRAVGRSCGAAAALVLFGSVALYCFGVSWFAGAFGLATLFLIGESGAAILEGQERLMRLIEEKAARSHKDKNGAAH